jgi:hypothetical protein
LPRKDATKLKIQNAHKELQKKNIRAGGGIITVNTTGVSPTLINQKAVFNEQLESKVIRLFDWNLSSFFVIEIIFSALEMCFDSKSTMSLLLALLSSKRLSVFEKWLPIHSLATSRSQSSSRRAEGAGGAGGSMEPTVGYNSI